MKNSLAIFCFVLSGFAGLVYEVCWIRMASLIFGSTTFALSSVLAIFFAGLALGSWLFGRIAQRSLRPLKLYAAFEILLAVLAVASPAIFGLADGAYGGLYRALASSTVLLFTARFLLVALVLLPPTVLMGATLPLFCRQFVRHEGRIASSVGFLYGANTLGAALGCAATGLWLLPEIGVQGSIRLGAGLNVLAGVAVGLLPLAAPACAARPRAEKPETASTPSRDRHTALVAALFFVTGLVALGGEVIWTRFLALVVRNNMYTYTITLTVVLTGIVLGSLLAARLFDRNVPRAFSFGILQALSALSVLVLMFLPVAFWRGLGQGPAPYIVLMLLPAIFSGASFPLANRMVLDDPALSARSVGRMAAINTAGGIAGSLLIGFVVLPLLGLSFGLRLVTGIGLLAAFTAWRRLEHRVSRNVIYGFTVAAVLIWLGAPRITGTRVPADFLAPPDQLVDFKEGYGSTLAAVRKKGALHLEIDRLWQGKDGKTHQIMAAHVPMLVHPSPRQVLVVGVGTGQTASRFLMYDVERLDCVDIEPVIFDFIARNFDSTWMRDERVRLIDDDGRNYLIHADQQYDIVSIEVGQIFRPGVETFYTEEFYRRAARRLRPGGMLVQFVPLPFFTVDDFRSVLRTFLDVFPQSVLWYNTSELLLLGTQTDRIELQEDRLRLLETDAAVNADLRYSHWGGRPHWLNRREVFLGGFLCGPRQLTAMAGTATTYRDDRPVLAYATSKVTGTQRNEVPLVDLMRRHLAPVSSVLKVPLSGDAANFVERVREMNLRDLIASAHLRTVEALQADLAPARVIEMLQNALSWNPESAIGNRMLADALSLAGRLQEAEQYYANALRLRDDDALSRRGLAFVFLQTGRLEEAVQYLRAALQQLPDDAATHNYLGAALAPQGRIDEAVRHFREAARLRPDDPDIRRNLERALQQLQSSKQPR